jgi:hypothetical protein
MRMTPEPQQVWPSPPQGRQVRVPPPMPPPPHAKPVLQVRCAAVPVPQQGWLLPPQAVHDEPPAAVWQAKPVLHVPAPKPPLGQQG